jgi:hypothetical protein
MGNPWNWPPPAPLTSSQVKNLSTVLGTTVTDALNTLVGAVVALTSDNIANASGVVGATVTAALNTLGSALAALTTTSIANASGVAGVTCTAALDALNAAIAAANAVIAALTSSSIANASTVSGATVTAALDALKTVVSVTQRDELWDPPTTANNDNDEFTSDSILSGAWNIGLASSPGTPLTRDGAIDVTANTASSHYRSTCIGSTLLVQIHQNEQVWVWRQVAAALSTEQLWLLGLSFPTEVGTASASDPGCSLQLAKQTGSVPDSANRTISQMGSSADRLIVNALVGGVAAGPVNSNNIQLGQVHGLALRNQHGSGAANNATGFGFNRNGVLLTPNNITGPQLNASTTKVVIGLFGNTTTQIVPGANNVIFGLHFLRRIALGSGTWLQQT